MTFLLTLQLDILFPQVALETEELYDVSPVPLLGNAEESELEWMRTTRMGGAGRILVVNATRTLILRITSL